KGCEVEPMSTEKSEKAPSKKRGTDDIKATENGEKATSKGCEVEPMSTEKSEKAPSIDLGTEPISTEKSEKATSEGLILGKFKSVEDLSKAYTELEKHQGENSSELGILRKNAASMENLAQRFQQISGMQGELTEYLNEYKNKYDTPEYFQNQSFKEIYREAFKLLGSGLDTDKFVELIENYANSRILENEKSKLAKEETQKVLSLMTYSKNPKSSIIPPKKSFDEMSEKEVDELLERII
ncbi:MAG: hypothetical protein MJ231_06635, partial [bacterium]|nr:hypothetical protein [bacterium]